MIKKILDKIDSIAAPGGTQVNVSNFVTKDLTGAFYPASNPSGFATRIDLDLTNYIATSQTGQFYAASNPSGFVTSGSLNLSNYVTNRGIASVTTTSIASNGTFNATVDFGCKSYGLISVSGSSGAWVKLYYDTSSRASDATRTIDQDPSSNVYLMAESVSNTNDLIRFAPATIGYNEGINNLVPIAITNTRNTNATYTIEFNFLKL